MTAGFCPLIGTEVVTQETRSDFFLLRHCSVLVCEALRKIGDATPASVVRV